MINIMPTGNPGQKRTPKAKAAQIAVRKKKLIKAMLKNKGLVTYACKAAGLGTNTFYLYYNGDPAFKKACDACQDINLDNAESKLQDHIDNDNWSCLMFYLKCKGKKRGYVERQEIITDMSISIDAEGGKLV